MHKNIISIDHKIGTKIRKGIRNLVNHPFLSTRVINFRHSVLLRRRGKVLSDTTMCKWNGRIVEEAKQHRVDFSFRRFLGLAKNNTSSLFDFSASPFHGIRWDLRIGLRFSGRIHGVSVTLHRENPFRFDDSSALPTKQLERREE